MKFKDNLELLEEYLDGDPGAEEELFARYDREIEVSPAVWAGIEERIVPAAATSNGWWMKIAAVLILSIGLGSVYLLTREEKTIPPVELDQVFARLDLPKPPEQPEQTRITRTKKPTTPKRDNPGVVSSDLAYLDLDDQDTVNHLEQTQNLLRSIRNVTVSDGDEEIDVTYDKALSQRLLNENVVLRRDAEMKAKFPTKTLLADLEPLLIDIANLPDHARPEEVRAIKERVDKTEIVAALIEYRDRGTNNR
ncbi:MAG TPA: hypothetical protein VFR51_15820 [Pyrinomonadaceae bacterium]|nr:hypothetical protein [Pyrinomonadaceae bacterium]